MRFGGKNIVIYGAGASGLSAYALLRELGGSVVIYDDNPSAPQATDNPAVFADADMIVVSPSVPSANKYLLDARLGGKSVVSELELSSSICSAEQIAVTGTNGKTTTTLLIQHILSYAQISAYAVGNIGKPFSSICDKLDAMETAVVEASSFQLESATSFSPDISVILNITPDHLDRHGTVERYAAAKANVFLRQAECDTTVYNADDALIRGLVPLMNAKRIPFSIESPVEGAYISSEFVCYKGLPVVELKEIDFKGREVEDVLAAVAVAMSKGLSRYTVASALCSFRRPEYRRTESAIINGIKIVNDSKATNIASALSAAEGASEKTVLLLGGADRGENFEELFSLLPDNVVAAVVTGENAEKIISAGKSCGYYALEAACDLEEGVQKGLALAKELQAEELLFSPASKSYDCFTGFEERGRAFDNIVQELKRKFK